MLCPSNAYQQKGSAAVVIVVSLLLITSVALGYYFISGKSTNYDNRQDSKVELDKIKQDKAEVDASLLLDQPLDKQSTVEVRIKPSPTIPPSLAPTFAPKLSVPSSDSALTLMVEAKAGGVLMKWTGDSDNGFKACFSEREHPSYPSDNCTFKSTSERSHEVKNLQAGKTYHFRVGIYGKDGKVSTYSNDVTAVPTPGTSDSSSSSSGQKLNLTAVSNDSGKVSLSWTLDGDPVNGFKEVWAEHENPTYPEDHWNYDADTGLRSYTWTNLTPGQSLHFRVGVYKSGQGVVAYSNDVAVKVK